MKKIPSIFVRRERSSLVETSRVTVGCEWVFAPHIPIIVTVKRDGTPLQYKDGAWLQRRTLKSKLDPGVDGIPTPRDFTPCQDHPEFDDESHQWEWPGWVPLETQYKALVDEAVKNRGGMNSREHGCTFELCGPKINGNPERLETHQLFTHASEVILAQTIGVITPEQVLEMVTACPYEGIVLYWCNADGKMQTAKLKRRDLGLDWPLKVIAKN